MIRDMTWAGGQHDFSLPIELLRAMQDRCDAGPAWVLARLSSGKWLIDDVILPIRLGLEGGGLDKEVARKLTKQFVEDRPLTLSVHTAQAIMLGALYGTEEEGTAGELKTVAPE